MEIATRLIFIAKMSVNNSMLQVRTVIFSTTKFRQPLSNFKAPSSWEQANFLSSFKIRRVIVLRKTSIEFWTEGV